MICPKADISVRSRKVLTRATRNLTRGPRGLFVEGTSPIGPKRTNKTAAAMSAFRDRADLGSVVLNVAFWPIADMAVGDFDVRFRG